MSGLISRVPVGRTLADGDADDANWDVLRLYVRDDPHDIVEGIIGRAPTPEEVGARMQNALNTPEKPGHDSTNPGVLSPSDYWPKSTLIGQVLDQWSGEGRREENIPELPPYLVVNGDETWAYSDIGKARDDRDKMVQIAARQLPGSTFRRDAYGNPIITVPQGTQAMESRVAGIDEKGEPVMERKSVPLSGEYYLNRPGFSLRDAANFGQDALYSQIGGKLGALVAGPPGAILGPALTSAIEDMDAGRVGADFSPDPVHMARAAGISAATSIGRKLLGW